MIKYNTGDIVKRASQLADLENSSFISWNENVQMLNEAYQKLYQKTINHDDKTFLVEVPLGLPAAYGQRELRFALPDDFFQLYSIRDANTGKIVVRKSMNDPVSTVRYDIINNELVISGDCNMALVMSYFPVPQTLTLKAKPVKAKMPTMTGMIFSDMCDKRVVWLTGDRTNGYKVWWHDLESETSLNANVPDFFTAGNQTIVGLIATKIGILLYTDDAHWVILAWNNLGSVLMSGMNGIMPVFITRDKSVYYIPSVSDGILHGIDYGGLSLRVKDVSDSAAYAHFAYTQLPGTFRGCVGFLEDDLGSGFLLRQPDGFATDYDRTVYRFDFDKGIYEAAGDFAVDFDGFAYVIGGFTLQQHVLRNISRNMVASGVVGVNKLDDDTGYGYTTSDGFIHGIFDDTEISYPNNAFVQLISYFMAIQYKSKQNADAAGLVALYQNAEEQFYDSIGRDDFQYTRINNVY